MKSPCSPMRCHWLPTKSAPIPRKSLEISKTPIPLQGFDIHRDLQLLHQHGSHPPRLPANLTWQRHRQNSVRPKCGKPNAVNLPFGDGFRQPNQPIKMMILGIDSGFSTVISYLIQNTGCLKVPKNQTSPFSREHSATIAANRCTGRGSPWCLRSTRRGSDSGKSCSRLWVTETEVAMNLYECLTWKLCK